MELSKALSIYGNLRVYEDYSEAMVLTAHGLFPIRQSSFLAMNKHQVEFCGFIVSNQAMRKLNSLLCYVLGLEHVLELLQCLPLTRWIWSVEGLQFRLKSRLTSTEECSMHWAPRLP
ncbi:unnamed protein product [Musa textilis]